MASEERERDIIGVITIVVLVALAYFVARRNGDAGNMKSDSLTTAAKKE
jgi:hypothetical protein